MSGNMKAVSHMGHTEGGNVAPTPINGLVGSLSPFFLETDCRPTFFPLRAEASFSLLIKEKQEFT